MHYWCWLSHKFPQSVNLAKKIVRWRDKVESFWYCTPQHGNCCCIFLGMRIQPHSSPVTRLLNSVTTLDHYSFTFNLRIKFYFKQIRQLDFISKFTLTIKHIQGHDNTVTDTLSRTSLHLDKAVCDFETIAIEQKSEKTMASAMQTNLHRNKKYNNSTVINIIRWHHHLRHKQNKRECRSLQNN